ncbi:helix-turn-helix domain-containing protein [Candidatus Woesearchaeota archaeon]|nr:helix-turn-helix domain-containing protein [Candidatus Woesearchaeota archaeon]
MRDKPYEGMGNVSKAKGLFLEKKKEKRMSFYLSEVPWASVPVPMQDDPEAKGNDLLVYLAINSFADKETATAFPSQEKLTKRAKRKRKTVMETISHLVEIGWATKIRRGQGKANITVLHHYKGEKFTKEQLNNIKELVKKKINNYWQSSR